MGLISKFKDILFEEEEITEPIKVVKEEKKVVEAPKREVEEKPISRQIQPEKKVEPTPVVREQKSNNTYDTVSERDLFRTENTFPFPEFDEEEFNNSLSRPKPKNTNVLEYERKKRTEKRTDYGRYERTEVREVVEKKKFKPSPIISPVYGILNEDYKPEDIKDKKDLTNELDIDSVRRKAFEPALEILEEEPKTTYYEETVTVKVKEPEEEKQQKVKTIDELLEDTADITIDIDNKDKRPRPNEKVEYDEIDEELEEMINIPKENKKIELEEDDTLENDLFDLIDSMYDNREDGEF